MMTDLRTIHDKITASPIADGSRICPACEGMGCCKRVLCDVCDGSGRVWVVYQPWVPGREREEK